MNYGMYCGVFVYSRWHHCILCCSYFPLQLVREPVNPAETMSINVCGSPSSTPVESPSITVTDPMTFGREAIIASTVAVFFATFSVVVVVALIVIHKKHKTAKEKLR